MNESSRMRMTDHHGLRGGSTAQRKHMVSEQRILHRFLDPDVREHRDQPRCCNKLFRTPATYNQITMSVTQAPFNDVRVRQAFPLMVVHPVVL